MKTTTTITTRITNDLHKKVKLLAEAKETTASKLIADYMEELCSRSPELLELSLEDELTAKPEDVKLIAAAYLDKGLSREKIKQVWEKVNKKKD